METQQLTPVGGLTQNGFGDLGAGVVDVNDLPTPDPFRLPLLTFTVPAGGTETVSFTIGPQASPVTVYWGDGTSSTVSEFAVTHNYTGLTPGNQVTITTDKSFTNFFKDTNFSSLENLIFWWDAIKGTSANLVLKDIGLTRRMNPTMSGFYSNFNLKGNSISGDFPNLITAKTLFIDDNNFTGDLPQCLSNQINYVIKGNAFRGAIHDISANAGIKRYSAYGQDDGTRTSFLNPHIMLTGEITDLSSCSALTYYHVGNGGLIEYNYGLANKLTVASDFDVNTNIEEFYAGSCGLSESGVDLILAKFAAKSGTFNNPNKLSLGGNNAQASAAGLVNKVILQNAGWTVITAPDF
tara:strand:- start:52 stop:1107 length:1056 start_codon:yes stop_codon:yes gene_type:complete